jgi:hypothetical protein
MSREEQRLVALRDMEQRWIAESSTIPPSETERAQYHAEALADLRRVIEQLENAVQPVGEC